MAVVVQKYGGSSLADFEKLAFVADKIARERRSGTELVIVVSAMGKTTERLLALARRAACEGPCERGLTDVPRRELDMLVSTGERVSMSLLSIALQARGLDAVSFTGSQSGILTDNRHFDARIVAVKPRRIQDELARGRIVIVAGYQGMSAGGEITTLGRGGSDTTAVALAAALGAERCEIHSDVDGVYSADPRRVGEAVHLPELDYELMQAMAEHGAKVLNAQAVEWARREGILIEARRTTDAPDARCTRIGPFSRGTAQIRAVVVEPRLAIIEAPAPRTEDLVLALDREGVSVRKCLTSSTRCHLWIPLTHLPSFDRTRAALEAQPGVVVSREFSAVTVLGAGVGRELSELLLRLRARALPTQALGVEPLAVSLVVGRGEAGEVERLLHGGVLERACA